MRNTLALTVILCIWLNCQMSIASDSGSLKDSVPTTVEECVKILEKRESKQTLDKLKAAKDNELYKFNRGLGAAIRNDWIWGHSDSKLVQFFMKNGIRQPDGMSAAIIHCLRRDLNNQPLELDKKMTRLSLFELRQQPVSIEKLIIAPKVLNEKLDLNNGKVVTLADYRGKLLVFILFDWRSQIDVKEMNELKAAFSKQNVEILGAVAMSGSPEYEQFIKDFSKNYKLDFPVSVESPPNFGWEVGEALVEPGIFTYPETFLINKESMMIARYKGWQPDTLKILKGHIEMALKGEELK